MDSCQKNEVNPVDKTEGLTELTIEQLQLKEKMNQAALVLVEFSNDKEIQKEIQDLIDLKMYRDDYIKFKDLFQPESNDKLKSIGSTKFAKKFRETISANKFKKLKNSEDFDLETFLIENDLRLYVPYPLEDYPEDMRTPTISFHPLDNDSVNIGYKLLTNKSTNNVQQVEKVNEEYSINHPLYLIVPIDDEGTSGGYSGGTGGGTGGTGGGSNGNSAVVRLEKLRLNSHFEALYNGKSEVQIIFAEGVAIGADGQQAIVHLHYNAEHDVKRRQVRHKEFIPIGIVLDTDWKEEELVNYFAAVEIDKIGKVKFDISVSIKTKIGTTITPKLSVEYQSNNDFIGNREITRGYFMDSQTDPEAYSLDVYEGLPVRKCGELDFTTKVIYR